MVRGETVVLVQRHRKWVLVAKNDAHIDWLWWKAWLRCVYSLLLWDVCTNVITLRWKLWACGLKSLGLPHKVPVSLASETRVIIRYSCFQNLCITQKCQACTNHCDWLELIISKQYRMLKEAIHLCCIRVTLYALRFLGCKDSETVYTSQ